MALLLGRSAETQAGFAQSCFGQFVGQPKIVRSSAIISHLVLRTGSFEGETTDGLLIEIGGQVREFTKRDFQEITFLKVVDDYEEFKFEGVVSNDSLFKKFFPGKYLSRNLVNQFLEASVDWPTEVQVNYLKIYFVLNVLLADDAKNRTPCLELIKAVEDTDTFGRHPWGNVVWNYLLGEVRKFVEKGGEPMEQGKKKRKLHLPGFVEPLQVWGYECLPFLTNMGVCEKVSTTARPIMRRWKSIGLVQDAAMRGINFNEVINL